MTDFNLFDMQDLTYYLIEVAKKQKIGLKVCNDWPADWNSVGHAELNLICYNPNFLPAYRRPIELAHEIGHVLAHHPSKNPVNTKSCDEGYEEEANKIAIKLILKYIQENDLQFETRQQLMDSFGIPESMVYSVDKVINSKNTFQYNLFNTVSIDGLF